MCSLLTALLYAITAAQVALYVVALWQNNWLVEQLSRNPLVGPSETRLHALGSLATSDLTDLRQYWRLASSTFLCSGAQCSGVPLLGPVSLPEAVLGHAYSTSCAQGGLPTVRGQQDATRAACPEVTPARPALAQDNIIRVPTLCLVRRRHPAGADSHCPVDFWAAHCAGPAVSGAGRGPLVPHPGARGVPGIRQPLHALHSCWRTGSCLRPHR